MPATFRALKLRIWSVFHPFSKRLFALVSLEVVRPPMCANDSLHFLITPMVSYVYNLTEASRTYICLFCILVFWLIVIPNVSSTAFFPERDPIQSFKMGSPICQEVAQLPSLATCISPTSGVFWGVFCSGLLPSLVTPFCHRSYRVSLSQAPIV